MGVDRAACTVTTAEVTHECARSCAHSPALASWTVPRAVALVEWTRQPSGRLASRVSRFYSTIIVLPISGRT